MHTSQDGEIILQQLQGRKQDLLWDKESSNLETNVFEDSSTWDIDITIL